MTGAYEISIKFKKVKYLLSVKHNITVITGESATGKTALVSAVREHSLRGASSGVVLDSEVKCRVLEGDIENMRISVDSYPECIFFVDEEYVDIITTSEFASMVNTADAYFVIVTRENLKCLSYSVDAVKELKNNKGKYNNIGNLLAINELSNITSVSTAVGVEKPRCIYTEDSNAGFKMLSEIFKPKVDVQYIGGKDKIYNHMKSNNIDNCVYVVDGAAFGCCVIEIKEYLETHNCKCTILCPASFEYMILHAGIIKVSSDKVYKPWLYADSKRFLSLERYYTDMLIAATRDTQHRYKKTHLNSWYYNDKNISKLVNVMPGWLTKVLE